MIAVIQRINGGSVCIDGERVAEAKGHGLLLLLGVSEEDTREDAALLAPKIAKLRIFSDREGKMNLSLLDVDGEVIVVSNFTLLASYRKGNRPDYMHAARPEKAEELYEYFVELMKEHTPKVSTGRFGADMQVSLVNDGPVTIVMDSNVLKQPKNGNDYKN